MRFEATRELGRTLGPLAVLLRIHQQQAWRKLLAIRQQSRLLALFVTSFLSGYFLLAFALFWKGLRFIASFPGLGTLMTERLLFLMFFFLFVLLWFSNLVISYTNLFRNRETQFLLSLPLDRQVVFQWKFLESTILASWAFLFLIAPLLVAYGLTTQVPWHFFLAMPSLVALFIVLPAIGGAWSAIQIARFLDRRNFQLIALGVFVVVLVYVVFAFKPVPIPDEALETRVLEVLDRLLSKTRFAQIVWLPSYWLSASILQWSEGALIGAVFFLLLLLSYVLFFGYLALTQTSSSFYDGASAVQSRAGFLMRWPWLQARLNSRHAAYGKRSPLDWMIGLIPGLADDVRALVIKDIRVFWRDTTQWGQTLVLFGLLGVYIINLRHFRHQFNHPFWINLVGHLNLLACALNLATLTTRFVFPQFSLEGKRLWIIGLAPIGMEKIIRVKFLTASLASLVVTLGLIFLSCHMLLMPWIRTFFFVSATGVMTLTLTGMAIGLGALYPNFKEDNPGKIVSGFGGTFCLILSFLYILGAVALLAMGSSWTPQAVIPAVEWLSVYLLFLGWSWAFGWIPFRAGIRRLKDFEWITTS